MVRDLYDSSSLFLYLCDSKNLIINLTYFLTGTTRQDLNSIVHGTLTKAIVKNGDLLLKPLTLERRQGKCLYKESDVHLFMSILSKPYNYFL